MRVLALVKHYLKANLTDVCVQSLAHELPLDRVVVVDGSADQYEYRHPIAASYPLVPNLGLLESFNRVLASRDDWDLAWCLNNDVVVSAGCLHAMVRVFEKPRHGIVAPLSSDTSVGHHSDGPVATPGVAQIVRHVDNHAWMFSRALVGEVGWPDGWNFPGPGWGGNLDFCYRTRLAGFLVCVSLGSYVHHTGGATLGDDPDYRRKAEAERDENLRRKYGDPAVVW